MYRHLWGSGGAISALSAAGPLKFAAKGLELVEVVTIQKVLYMGQGGAHPAINGSVIGHPQKGV